MSSEGAFDNYWRAKVDELQSVYPEIFLQGALKYGYFPESGVLPEFFTGSFDTTNYIQVKSKRERIEDSSKYKTIYDLHTFDLVKFTHTNGSGYRVYSLVHPFNYWMLCKELADNLPTILKTLTKKRNIVSYSIPDLMNLEFRREDGIKAWIQMSEKDLISESGKYSYLLKADIASFYDSVYTHSISWAIHGKTIAKKKRLNFSLLGNRLDKLVQTGNNGQTNGLPIGPVTSDILCELVLAALDESVSKKLRKLGIKYKAARYKDDYRFLTHSHEDAARIKKILTETLHEYGMSINQNKTTISNDIIESYSRSWKHTLYKFGLDNIKPNGWIQLSSVLDGIYRHQKESINKQPSLSLLEDVYQYISEGNPGDIFDAEVMSEIVVKLVHMFRLLPATLPHSIQIIDTLLDSQDSVTRRSYINMFTDHFDDVVDDDLVAWLYRLHLRISEDDANQFLSHKLRKKSKMRDLLQGKWIFEDSGYSGGGFSRKSVVLVDKDLINEARTLKIRVGFRYLKSS